MGGTFFQTLDADTTLESFKITQTTKDAMAKIKALSLPPASMEVVKKVVVVIALKFSCYFFTRDYQEWLSASRLSWV